MRVGPSASRGGPPGRRLTGSASALVAALVVLAALSSAAAGRDGGEPPAEAREQIGGFVEALDRILSDPDASPDARRALLEREIDARLDFGAMAAVAIGPLSQKLPPEQFADLAREYARHMTHFYVSRLARSGQADFEIEGASFDAARGHATFRVRGANRPPPPLNWTRQSFGPDRPRQIDLRTRERAGQWRIFSVVIDGVSVEQNFREQFAAFVQRSDPEALLAELRRRNAENDASNPFAVADTASPP